MYPEEKNKVLNQVVQYYQKKTNIFEQSSDSW